VKQWQRKKIEELTQQAESLLQAKKRQIPKDFYKFCLEWLGLKLTDYQQAGANLIEKNDSVALRWSRQSGKTHLIAAWLLHSTLGEREIRFE